MSRELSPSSISLLCSLLDARAMLAAVLAGLVMSPKTMLNCAHTGNARRSLARTLHVAKHCMRSTACARHARAGVARRSTDRDAEAALVV